MARKSWAAQNQRMAPSKASFVAPYGLLGSVRSASAIGTRRGNAGLLLRLQRTHAPVDGGAVVGARVDDRLADQRARGAVLDGVAAIGQDLAHPGPIVDVADLEAGALRDRGAMPARQVVVD